MMPTLETENHNEGQPDKDAPNKYRWFDYARLVVVLFLVIIMLGLTASIRADIDYAKAMGSPCEYAQSECFEHFTNQQLHWPTIDEANISNKYGWALT